MGAKKNKLADLEIEAATEIERQRRKRKSYPESGKTRIARDVKAGKRKPPPVPKNKGLSEIKELDPHDPIFRHPDGRKRKWIDTDGTPVVDESELSWKDVIRKERQRKANDRRAKVRKHEAMVQTAQRTLETHVTDGNRELDIYDEEKLLAEGILDFEDWDNEELIRGYRRNRAGRFGAPPKYIPREVQQAAFRLLVNRGERRMKEGYYEAIEALVTLAHSADSEKVKLEAIKELMNRVVGKVPDRMLVAREEPWEGILVDSMVPVSEVPALEMEVDEQGVARLPYMELGPEEGGGSAPQESQHRAADVDTHPDSGVETPPPSPPRSGGRKRRAK